jgi:hypothetical protein
MRAFKAFQWQLCDWRAFYARKNLALANGGAAK